MEQNQQGRNKEVEKKLVLVPKGSRRETYLSATMNCSNPELKLKFDG
jgi:hypothetical protein